MESLLFFIFLGAFLLYLGGEFLVESASQIAHKWGVSPLVIGIIIVGYGTSLPELFVSIQASLEGSADLSVGNVVGSNICNIGMILGGILFFFGKIPITNKQQKQDLPILALLTALGTALLWNYQISFGKALFFLALSTIYTLYMFFSDIHVEEGEEIFRFKIPLWGLLFVATGSFLVLIAGAYLFVRGATGLAKLMGVSEAVIGLTVVAIGTSLPEVATSIVASFRKKHALALGNIMGSCVFNLFFILGVLGILAPVEVKGISRIDFLVMSAFSACLLVFALFSKRNLTRTQGGILFFGYIAYIFFLLNSL